jgi:PilZ domain
MSIERDQRQTFRVIVKPKSGLTAALYIVGQRLPATVGDISPEGMFVRLDRGLLSALRVGGTVGVEVSFDDERVELTGVIRSQRGGGYGIHFPPRDEEGRPNPRDKLARISACLQRTDLSQRLKVLKLPE